MMTAFHDLWVPAFAGTRKDEGRALHLLPLSATIGNSGGRLYVGRSMFSGDQKEPA
jgi:hypothetical protein